MPPFRPSLVLPAQLVEPIDQSLARLQGKTQALYVLLTDESGQLISAAGRVVGADPASVAALAASNLAATKELSRLAGNQAAFGHLLHEGKQRSIYLGEIAQRFVLVVVFEPKTHVGLVRLLAKQTVQQLEPWVAQLEERAGQAGSWLDSDFANALSEDLDRALGPQGHPSDP